MALHYLKVAYKKDGEKLFKRSCCDRTRGNGLKLKEGRFRTTYKEESFYKEGAGILDGTGCPQRWQVSQKQLKAALDRALLNLI